MAMSKKNDDEATSLSLPSSDDESNQISITKKTVAVDREAYLSAHRDLTFERNQLQIKNNILHRRLAEYYKKRHLEHVLKPIERNPELEEKYKQKLLAYEELKLQCEVETAAIKQEVALVQNQYEVQNDKCEQKFEVLQNYERNTGTGLIYAKKGAPISDKTVQRYLTLQKSKASEEAALCLRYIRARNAVADLEEYVKKLEIIGPGLYVAAYEQLRIDRLSLQTKIEEREDELARNRTKCQEYNQILCHIREKMSHTDEVIDITECNLGDTEIKYQKAREDLSIVKSRRNNLRWQLEAEAAKAGLLIRKDLLRDYQNATEELEKLTEYKQYLETEIANTHLKLKSARQLLAQGGVSSCACEDGTDYFFKGYESV